MAHDEHWKRLGDGSLLTEDADEGLGHIVSTQTYLKILLTLFALTILTVWVSTKDFGTWNTVIAMVIATIKGLLVALFFMHLKFEKKTIIMYAIYPLVLLCLLIGSNVRDVEMRERPQPLSVPTANG